MRYRVEFEASLTGLHHIMIVHAASPGQAVQEVLAEHEAIFLQAIGEMPDLSLGKPKPWHAPQEVIAGQMAAIREAIEVCI